MYSSISGGYTVFTDLLATISPSNKNSSLQGPFKCEQCGKEYAHKRGLWTHTKFVCGKTPQFQCEFCLKYFSRKDNMIVHQRIKHCINFV